MKKLHSSFRYFCALLVISHGSVLQANVFETWDNFKKQCAFIAWKVHYYAPYVVVPAVGAFVGA